MFAQRLALTPSRTGRTAPSSGRRARKSAGRSVTEDNIFAIGMVEDIIDALSVSPSLKVLASGSTAAFRKNSVDVAEIGRTLGVRYLMEGNIRRIGDALRVTAQLIEAATGAILWAQKFDRPLSELAQLQEDLVVEVATSLGSQIERLEIERVLKKPASITAYEACVRATIASAHGDFSAGKIEAERAVALAPDYGGAHACLAMTLCGEYQSGCEEAGWWPRAKGHIARALALDPGNAYVRIWVGLAYTHSGRPAEALPFMESGVAANPSSPTGRHARSITYAALGRFDEAMADSLAAEALSPNSPSLAPLLSSRAIVQLAAGQVELARASIDDSLRIMPISVIALRLKVIIAQMLGDEVGARTAVQALRTHHPAYDRERTLKMSQRPVVNSHSNRDIMAAAFAAAWDNTPVQGTP